MIAIETKGRRHYITGDTYPIRRAIRGAGCKWDADAKAWWTGKRETAETIVSGVATGSVEAVCSWRKIDTGFAVSVPAGMAVSAGSEVCVQSRDGRTKTVTLVAEVAPGLWSVPARKPRSSSPYREDSELRACRRRGWDGVIGSPSYYASGAFDELDM